MSSSPPSLLPPEYIAMIDRGPSTIVSSRDAAGHPSITRALGCSIAPDGSSISVHVARRQSRQLLQDIAATGWVAVGFSEWFTNVTVQVKSHHARTRNADASDAPLLERYLASMEQVAQQLGYAPGMAGILLSHRPDDVVVVSFEPELAFEQTPGPKAGTELLPGGSA